MSRWGALVALSAVLSASGGSAENTFTVPALTGPVVDAAEMLSASTRDQVENYLGELYSSGGTQIQVVTVPSIAPLSVEEASIKIADQWKVGRHGQDTGVILLIAASEHKVRIEVGKGREGDLTDLSASRIIREQITPLLRAGRFDDAVKAGVVAIANRTDPDFHPSSRRVVGAERKNLDGGGLLTLLVLFFLILPLFFRGGGGGGGFLAGAVLGNLLGGPRDRGGGGGWSGGGGGFSGGGASGDW